MCICQYVYDNNTLLLNFNLFEIKRTHFFFVFRMELIIHLIVKWQNLNKTLHF